MLPEDRRPDRERSKGEKTVRIVTEPPRLFKRIPFRAGTGGPFLPLPGSIRPDRFGSGAIQVPAGANTIFFSLLL